MILIFSEDDVGLRIRTDEEGIDYLIQGLEALRDRPPGHAVSTPFLSETGVGELLLERA